MGNCAGKQIEIERTIDVSNDSTEMTQYLI